MLRWCLLFILPLFSELKSVCFLVCSVGKPPCLLPALFTSSVLTGLRFSTHVPPRDEPHGLLCPTASSALESTLQLLDPPSLLHPFPRSPYYLPLLPHPRLLLKWLPSASLASLPVFVENLLDAQNQHFAGSMGDVSSRRDDLCQQKSGGGRMCRGPSLCHNEDGNVSEREDSRARRSFLMWRHLMGQEPPKACEPRCIGPPVRPGHGVLGEVGRLAACLPDGPVRLPGPTSCRWTWASTP